jgi:hypothetical protein
MALVAAHSPNSLDLTSTSMYAKGAYSGTDARDMNRLGELNVEYKEIGGGEEYKNSLKEGLKVTLGYHLFPQRLQVA